MNKKICAFPECGKPVKGRGLCTGHIKQEIKGQDLKPLRTRVVTNDSMEYFYAKAEVRDGCWGWIGELNNRGYAVMWSGAKRKLGHRFSYEAFREPIPDGLVIDHLCGTTYCTNPEHLRAVTQGENMQNLSAKGYGNNPTGVRGVSIVKRAGGRVRYRARVKHLSKQHQIGTYATIEEAHQAIQKYRAKLFPYAHREKV